MAEVSSTNITDISARSTKVETSRVTKALPVKKKNIKKKLFVLFLVLVVLASAVALVLPLIPSLEARLNPPDPTFLKYPTSYSVDLGVKENNSTEVPVGNRLVIPKIGVDAEILEGNSEDVMLIEEGVWREPFGTDPSQLGNMILAGHRFQYLPPNTKTLYNLDQIVVGDKFLVYWEGKDYAYVVHSVFEVYPHQTEIRDASEIPNEITIYTCTPIFTSEKRLVVKARMI